MNCEPVFHKHTRLYIPLANYYPLFQPALSTDLQKTVRLVQSASKHNQGLHNLFYTAGPVFQNCHQPVLFPVPEKGIARQA